MRRPFLSFSHLNCEDIYKNVLYISKDVFATTVPTELNSLPFIIFAVYSYFRQLNTPTSKHDGSPNFPNYWASIYPIYQSYLVFCFTGFFYFVYGSVSLSCFLPSSVFVQLSLSCLLVNRSVDGTQRNLWGSHNPFRA